MQEKQIVKLAELVTAVNEKRKAVNEKRKAYTSGAMDRWLESMSGWLEALAKDMIQIDQNWINVNNEQIAKAEATKALTDKLLATWWGRIWVRLWWRKILKDA